MQVRLSILLMSILVIVTTLAGCERGALPAPTEVASGATTPEPTTPEAQRSPGAQRTRPAAFTPGAQRTPAARGTPQPTSTTAAPSSATNPAPTAVIVSVITSGSGQVPTAVPIPVVVIPTQAPATSATTAPPDMSVPSTAGPTLVPTPTATVAPSIEALRGKIIFFSDRGGLYPQLYVMEADGSNPRLCNCSDSLQILVNNEITSPDKRLFLFVKTVGSGFRGGSDQQIWVHNNDTNYESPVTGDAPGFPGVDYDPVWSPDSAHIAWVSEVDGNDEIYLHDVLTNENKRLTQNTWEFDKHPSFSPDGSQIVFWSNRESGTKQIWAMNLDGSSQHNLSQNQYNDWDPIWVK